MDILAIDAYGCITVSRSWRLTAFDSLIQSMARSGSITAGGMPPMAGSPLQQRPHVWVHPVIPPGHEQSRSLCKCAFILLILVPSMQMGRIPCSIDAMAMEGGGHPSCQSAQIFQSPKIDVIGPSTLRIAVSHKACLRCCFIPVLTNQLHGSDPRALAPSICTHVPRNLPLVA